MDDTYEEESFRFDQLQIGQEEGIEYTYENSYSFQLTNEPALALYQELIDQLKVLLPEENSTDTEDASEEDSRMRRQQLRRIISPFILRRTKAEVAEELPEKTDIIRRIVLSDSERTGYELMRERARKA